MNSRKESPEVTVLQARAVSAAGRQAPLRPDSAVAMAGPILDGLRFYPQRQAHRAMRATLVAVMEGPPDTLQAPASSAVPSRSMPGHPEMARRRVMHRCNFVCRARAAAPTRRFGGACGCPAGDKDIAATRYRAVVNASMGKR
jgi:hypothetical protein